METPYVSPNLRDVPLACGHWTKVHACSSTWEFPEDPLFCRPCGEPRMMTLDFIAQVLAARDGDL